MREPDPRTRAVAYLSYSMSPGGSCGVFFQPGKVTVVVMTTEVLETCSGKPLWVHGAAGSIRGARVWAEKCLWPGSVGLSPEPHCLPGGCIHKLPSVYGDTFHVALGHYRSPSKIFAGSWGLRQISSESEAHCYVSADVSIIKLILEIWGSQF